MFNQLEKEVKNNTFVNKLTEGLVFTDFGQNGSLYDLPLGNGILRIMKLTDGSLEFLYAEKNKDHFKSYDQKLSNLDYLKKLAENLRETNKQAHDALIKFIESKFSIEQK